MIKEEKQLDNSVWKTCLTTQSKKYTFKQETLSPIKFTKIVLNEILGTGRGALKRTLMMACLLLFSR